MPLASRSASSRSSNGATPSDRPECLLAHDQRLRARLRDDRRGQEPAPVVDPARQALAAERDARALGDRVRDLSLAVSKNLLVDQRPHRRFRRKGIADLQRLRFGDEPREELLIDRALDIDAIDAIAELARIREGVARDALDRHVDIRVAAHDGGALAAEFERQALERADRGRRYGLARDAAAGEGDLSRDRMFDQRHADLPAVAGHDIEAAWG